MNYDDENDDEDDTVDTGTLVDDGEHIDFVSKGARGDTHDTKHKPDPKDSTSHDN